MLCMMSENLQEYICNFVQSTVLNAFCGLYCVSCFASVWNVFAFECFQAAVVSSVTRDLQVVAIERRQCCFVVSMLLCITCTTLVSKFKPDPRV